MSLQGVDYEARCMKLEQDIERLRDSVVRLNQELDTKRDEVERLRAALEGQPVIRSEWEEKCEEVVRLRVEVGEAMLVIETQDAQIERLRAESEELDIELRGNKTRGDEDRLARLEFWARIEAALAKVDEFHRRPAAAADVDIHVTSRDLGRLVDAMVKALRGGNRP